MSQHGAFWSSIAVARTESLGALGYARERAAGMSGYAETLYQGLWKHYGILSNEGRTRALNRWLEK